MMKLTNHERDRLLVYVAAQLARDRRDRGVALGHPEVVALISDEMMEAAREGRSYEETLAAGRNAVSEEDVLDGVPGMVGQVQIEASYPEGTKLVTLKDPFGD